MLCTLYSDSSNGGSELKASRVARHDVVGQ